MLIEKLKLKFHEGNIHKKKIAEFNCNACAPDSSGYCNYNFITETPRTKNCPMKGDSTLCRPQK